uniref:ornithine decarboxylase n=1 Tax=Neogobius melanostomus TaxID=47308 RepID=A0A8C6SZK0_9GOBI
SHSCPGGSEVPFYVGNLDSVFEKHQKWQTLLPRVTPFYAVKCNNNLAVLRTLSALGTGFDCASKREIEMVMSIGVTPDKIIYAHATKPQTHIRYACAQGVDMMTFDNEEELLKITRGHPNAKLLLRIAVDDSKSQVKLSTKFGATLGTVGSLLKRAHELDLDVKGVSFHVGSLCTDSVAYRWAIEEAHHVFEQARLIGFHLDLLDIGGGFSGHGLEMVLNSKALDEFFPADSGVRVIAEPGRYFVDSAFTLALNVFARKKVWNMLMSADGNGLDTMIMYYVTSGLHGAFGDIKLYPDKKHLFCPRYQSVIWGPTCDGADRIMDVWMPELNIGDWILVDNFGAYTIPLSTDFNGFEKPTIYLVVTPQIWKMQRRSDLRENSPSKCGNSCDTRSVLFKKYSINTDIYMVSLVLYVVYLRCTVE